MRVQTFLYRVLTVIALLDLTMSGCGPAIPWSQIHSDIRNTSFQRSGPLSLDIAKAQTFYVGDSGTSSPVETPDGGILVTTSAIQNGVLFSGVMKVKPGADVPVTQVVHTLNVQFSTPAVDSEGNIYVGVNQLPQPPDPYPGSVRIWKYDSSGASVWRSTDLVPRPAPRPYVASVPKLIEINGKISLFVAAYGRGGGMILAVDGDGNGHTVNACAGSLTNPGIGATPTLPSPPTPPFPEDPGLTLALDGNGTPHLIDAFNHCGITFFRLATATTVPADWPPGLLFPTLLKTVEVDSTVSTAAVSAFSGYAILLQDSTFHAYDFTTGMEIPNWSIGTNAYKAWPPGVVLNSMLYMAAASSLKLGTIQSPSPITAPWNFVMEPRAIAVTLSMMYVLGKDGVFAFDTQMQLRSFAPIAEGGGLMVMSTGSLVVSSRNGTTYVFPPD